MSVKLPGSEEKAGCSFIGLSIRASMPMTCGLVLFKGIWINSHPTSASMPNNPLLHAIYLRFLGSKRGQTLAEYSLILAFISVVAISVLAAMGGQVKGAFSTINSQLSTTPTTTASPSGSSGSSSHGN
jgi:Flp pilus assembly pilin Flp